MSTIIDGIALFASTSAIGISTWVATTTIEDAFRQCYEATRKPIDIFWDTILRRKMIDFPHAEVATMVAIAYAAVVLLPTGGNLRSRTVKHAGVWIWLEIMLVLFVSVSLMALFSMRDELKAALDDLKRQERSTEPYGPR